MPRCTIARLTVDRPYRMGVAAAIADWLKCQAEGIESEPNNHTPGTYTSRRRLLTPRGDGFEVGAQLKVRCAGHLSPETRKRVAKWLRSRADYLLKHNAVAMTSRRGWYRQDFTL